MRVTRARAQQGNDDATDATERAPLNQISSNASPKQTRYDDEELVPKTPAKTPAKTPGRKAKGKGRAKKGKKGKAAEEDEEEQTGAAPEEEQAADEAPTNEPTGDDVSKDASDGASEAPAITERPVTPAPRLTRRQLAMQEEEAKQATLSAQSQESEPEPAPVAEEVETTAEVHAPEEASSEDATTGAEEAQVESNPQEPIQEVEAPATVEPVEEAQDEPIPEVEEAPQEKADTVQTEHTTSVPRIDEPHGEEQPVEATATEDSSENQVPEADTEVPAPLVEVSSEPEPKTLVAERPSEDAMTPLRSHTSSRRASRSPSKSPMRLEESFGAIDALEEALENVTSVTSFNHANEVMSPQKAEFPKASSTQTMRSKALGKGPVPAPATKLSRTPSVAAPKSMKPVKSSMARASSVRTAPNKDVRVDSTDTVDYLASKRRPISMSFPTPAAPAKGRAPTKATFQLSSNDVVAKLKAQKEERQKRETEGVVRKPRPISMPPPPKSDKPLTKPAFQLPGERIAEKLKAQKEERLKREAEASAQPAPKQRPVSISMAPKQRPVSISMAPHAKSTKALTKATFELPGSAVAEKLRIKKEERLKRMEEAEAAKKEAALKTRQAPVRKPVTVPIRQQQPGVTIAPPQAPQTQTQLQPQLQPQPQAQRASSLASKRSSMSLSQPLSQSRSTSTSSANRNSVIVPKAIVTPVDAAQQKVKGREVFNRDRMEKEARERERREKEEAAKRARAEAAERGRIASREWAERQRKKLMGV
ncbi:uncharacterized protein J4E88_000912 [Alternaria novae-zelandiae]|uniref:uncharacterized protein n=1 Tax=Alternaria novae-zelandiae TaxID=430562 RepID=UPI0020C1DE0D|nr:uncharacterized protein J4E88_000912 [Alternaria novae-zelandiae]KAI4696734.1 hypothetical protein J4E88_000912 [Alternaria novae-zelandiae]